MAKTSKKVLGATMAGVMAVGAVAGATNALQQVTVANAAESQAVKDAKAKIDHTIYSINKNYAGIKNQATWEGYIKEARALIAKIPAAEKEQADALTKRVDGLADTVMAIARINQVEKSYEANFHGIKNAATWQEYLDLAKEDMKSVDQTVFATKYEELVNRFNKASNDVKVIVDAYNVELADATKLYDAAVKSMKIEDAQKALEAAKALGTHKTSDELKAKCEALIAKINTKFTVSSINTDNLKTIKVNFNKEIDKATLSASNVKTSINDVDKAQIVTLSSDKKTVTVKFQDGELSQSAIVKLAIDGVKAVNGDEITKYETSLKVLDTKLPTVTGIEVLNAAKIYVNVSEPINLTTSGTSKVWTEIQIDGQNFAGKVTSDVENNRLVLEPSTNFVAGTHEIKIAKLKDYAGFEMESQTESFTTISDTAAPGLVSIEAVGKDKFTLIFDEELSAKGTVILNGQDQTSNANIDSNDKKRLVVSNQNLPTEALVIDQVVKYKGQKDAVGNEITTEQTAKFRISDNTNAPTATVSVDKDNKIVVQFSQDVTGANLASSYELKDSKGNIVSFGTPIYDSVKKTATITPVYSDLDSSNKTNGGTFTLKIKKDSIKDTSARENKLAETALTAVVADQKAPTIDQAAVETGSATKIRVVFSEAMDSATLTNPSNYIFINNGTAKRVSDIENATVQVINNKTVVIDVKTEIPASNCEIAVQDLKDLAGIKVGFQEKKPIGASATFVSNASNPGNIKSIEQTSLNKVKITLKDDAPKFTAVSANDFKLSSTNASGTNLTDTGLFVSNAVLVDSGKAIELTISKNLTANVKTADNANESVYIYTVNAAGQADAAANTKNDLGAALNLNSTYINLADKVAPSLNMKAIDVNNDGLVDVIDADKKIVLTFNEDIVASDTAAHTALVIRDESGNRLVGGTGYTVAVSGKNATITIKPGVKAYTGTYTITLTDNITFADANGNYANDFSVKTAELSIGSKTEAEEAEATEKVVAYEGLKLTTDTEIATAVTSKDGNKEGAKDAVTGLAAGAAKTELENRIKTKDEAIVKASTIDSVTVSNVTIGNAANSDVKVKAVAKNSNGVELTTGVTYAWSVTEATDASTGTVNDAKIADLAFDNDAIVEPTITKVKAGDSGDNYKIKVKATKNLVEKEGIATVTLD